CGSSFRKIGPREVSKRVVRLMLPPVTGRPDRSSTSMPSRLNAEKSASAGIVAATGAAVGASSMQSRRPREIAAEPRVQRARAREVREQILHLVREHAPTLQIDVLGI